MTPQIDVRLFVFYLSNGLARVCEIELSYIGKNKGNLDLVCENNCALIVLRVSMFCASSWPVVCDCGLLAILICFLILSSQAIDKVSDSICSLTITFSVCFLNVKKKTEINKGLAKEICLL